MDVVADVELAATPCEQAFAAAAERSTAGDWTKLPPIDAERQASAESFAVAVVGWAERELVAVAYLTIVETLTRALHTINVKRLEK